MNKRLFLKRNKISPQNSVKSFSQKLDIVNTFVSAKEIPMHHPQGHLLKMRQKWIDANGNMFVCLMVFNAIFNNISVLLGEEPGENH